MNKNIIIDLKDLKNLIKDFENTKNKKEVLTKTTLSFENGLNLIIHNRVV